METVKNYIVQDPGSEEDVAKFECFSSRDTLVHISFDLCASALSWESLNPHMPKVGRTCS